MSDGGPLLYGYLAMAVINSFTQYINQTRSGEMQNRISDRNRQLAERQELQRQHFQLETAEKNAAMQREMALENHRYRLTEQAENFKKTVESIQWTELIRSWPLAALPLSMRANQINKASDTVRLRVILCDGDDAFRALRPAVKNQLNAFVCEKLGCDRLILASEIRDGQKNIGQYHENIFYALQDMPTLLIDSEMVNGELCLSAEIWGFGNQRNRAVVFRLPYQPRLREDGKTDPAYIRDYQDQVAAHLKILVGYVFDAYDLITYSAPPVLPRVAAEDDSLARCGGLIGDLYSSFYAKYLAPGDGSQTGPAGKPQSLPSPAAGGALRAENPAAFQSQILHEMRLDYALAAESILPDDVFLRCLRDSLAAWVALRSEQSVEEFVGFLADDVSRIPQYISGADRDYLLRLNEACQKKNSTWLEPLKNAVDEAAAALPSANRAGEAVKKKKKEVISFL